MHSEIFYEKKNEPYTGKHDNLNLCEKETYPLAKISASFQNPKRDFKNHALRCSCTYLYEELQPCLTGLFQRNERYLKN